MSDLEKLGGLEYAEKIALCQEHELGDAELTRALIARVKELELSWRCFRCGEIFTDYDKAAEHFNGDFCEDEEPWCEFVKRMELAEAHVKELERERICHVCKGTCETCCSDCAIDLGARIYVHGSNPTCVDEHENVCPAKLKAKLQSAQELAEMVEPFFCILDKWMHDRPDDEQFTARELADFKSTQDSLDESSEKLKAKARELLGENS